MYDHSSNVIAAFSRRENFSYLEDKLILNNLCGEGLLHTVCLCKSVTSSLIANFGVHLTQIIRPENERFAV